MTCRTSARATPAATTAVGTDCASGARGSIRAIVQRAAGRLVGAALLILCCAGAVHAASATLTGSAPSALDAADPAGRGLAIFRDKDQRESGYGDLQVDLEMVLRDRRGGEARRELSISQLEVADDGDRLLVVFDTPKPIRGTALLSYSHAAGPDDQWLYLPAQRRVKKIASRNKSGPFLSSEFAYEDLALQEVEKYSYRFVGAEACGERNCLRVERVPEDEFSGYSREEVLLDEQTLRVERIEYFDRHERPLKVLQNSDFRLFKERYWKPGRMYMENLQTGKTTELLWREYRFDTGLTAERDFSTNSLMRAR